VAACHPPVGAAADLARAARCCCGENESFFLTPQKIVHVMARMMIDYDKLWDFHGIFRIPQVSEHFQTKPTIGTCFDQLGKVVGEKNRKKVMLHLYIR